MRFGGETFAALAAFIIVSSATFAITSLLILRQSPMGATDVFHLDDSLQELMTTRVCESPAVDGYNHISEECILNSPAAQYWINTDPDPSTDLITHIERRADYDGIAVTGGLGNKKHSVEECAAACRLHERLPNEKVLHALLPCNAFVFCPDEVCFEPDMHEHTKGDCWLKFTEAPAAPEVNMRGRLSTLQRRNHPKAPRVVQWQSGVLLPKGTEMTNGTWSPRYEW